MTESHITVSKMNLKNVMKYIEGDETVPRSEEHRGKYLENKSIIDTALNERNREHCNWVSTICFYAALHAVEMQLALDGIHSKNHIDREENMQNNERIPEYVLRRYKQMYTTSILARYEAGSVSPTIANQMRNYLKQIADKLGIEG